MSFNVSWIAARGDKHGLLQRLGLKEVGETNDAMNAPIAFATLPDGWMIVVSKEMLLNLPEMIASASIGGYAVGCVMSDTVMYSEGRAFQDGRPLWGVTHDPEKGILNCDVEGEPPPELTDIRKRLEAEQAALEGGGVDYIFDVPIELVESVCGYQPENFPLLEWTVLEPGQVPEGGGRFQLVVRSEIIPLALGLGWIFAIEKPEFQASSIDDLFRVRNGLHQYMQLEYCVSEGKAGSEGWFSVFFGVRDERPSSSGDMLLIGNMQPPRPSFLERLGSLLRKAPAKSAPDGILEMARRKIIAADTFLNGGERHPDVFVRDGTAKDTWPALPDESGPAV